MQKLHRRNKRPRCINQRSKRDNMEVIGQRMTEKQKQNEDSPSPRDQVIYAQPSELLRRT